MIELPHLHSPLWLTALLLLPLAAFWHHRQRSFGALTYSHLPQPASGSWRLHLPFYLRLLALALMIFAAARPQLGFAWEENRTEGIDIQIALDVSGSMAAEDFQPKNRLAVAKEVVKEFIDKRTADRLGVVVFAGETLIKAPLTTDRGMLRLLVDSVQLDTLPNGTAIGMALASSAARLKASTADSRVIVLVTDGVNNAGAVDPDSAAAICEGLGIKVYTIGVGTDGEVPIPVTVQNPLTGRLERRTVKQKVEIDEELLQKIAERTQGKFFRATDPDSLREIFAAIDELEKTPLEVKRYVRYEEAFQPLVWTAFGLLLLPLALALVGLTAEP